MANIVYTEFLDSLLLNTVDVQNDTLFVGLVNGYVPDKANQFWSQITTEVSGEGYTSPGVQLTSAALVRNDASGLIQFTANDVTWPASTLTATHAIIYKNTGVPSTSVLIACVDFGGTKQSVNGNFSVQWAEGGIFTLSQAV
jgi:hypothetical protein